MIPTVLSLQSKLDQANNKMLEKIHKLNNKFSKLESELCDKTSKVSFIEQTCKCGASLLDKRSKFNTRISRHNRHSQLSQKDVQEEKVVNIFQKLGCNIAPFDCIKACHSYSKRVKRVRQSSLSFHTGTSFGYEKGSMQNINKR